MMDQAGWDGQDQHMASASEDDFQHLLDMSSMSNMNDGMHFDFSPFQNGGAASQVMNQPRETPDTVMDLGNGDISNGNGNGNMVAPGTAMSASNQQMMQRVINERMAGDSQNNSDSISSIDAQIQFLQRQKYQQQQRQIHVDQQRSAYYAGGGGHHSVPPTPQSFEMPPGSGHFYSQADDLSQQGLYDGGYRHGRDVSDVSLARRMVSFTPLVSPAVTPLDQHFNIDGAFTVPGAYLSPIVSPALHAQRDNIPVQDYSSMSNHHSPADMDIESPQATSGLPNTDVAQRARKNNATKSRTKGATIKSSPISKPQRKRPGPSPAIVSQVLTEIGEDQTPVAEPSMLPLPSNLTEESEENASVSPENLNEMPPPPKPNKRSQSKSPFIQAQKNNLQQPPPSKAHPATPASLMKLSDLNRQKPHSNLQNATNVDNIETLELPESVSTTSSTSTAAGTPTPEAFVYSLEPKPPRDVETQRKPSPNGPTPGTMSASQSPQIRPTSSGLAVWKAPQPTSRNSKRRPSSVQVSPALLPRISPNIKPLLPGTPGMSAADDATSRLLTSKSNYQNILEGNTVPGVSYPSELSTNLTSKRTSHKIAEQGRRNRINSALQEMAGLLPDQPKSSDGEDCDKKDSKQSNAPNSKASVVENAIVHLKTLQQENVDLKKMVDELKKQLEGSQER